MWVAVFLVTNTWTITMAVFDVGQSVVNSAAGAIGGTTTIDISALTATINTTMESMELGELFVLMLETFILSFCMKIMSVLITVIMYGRMIEIYRASRSAAFHSKAVCGHFGNPALASR